MNQIVDDIRSILRQARGKAFTAVNFAMTEAYWHIGRRIVEEEQQGESRAEYGKQIIKELSKQLSGEFGRGFSEANLKNFRQFYLTFPENSIRYTLRSELSWSHYRLIMRVDNPKARQYYIDEAAGQNWSTRHLERNINTLYYERTLSAPSKETALQQNNQQKAVPADFIKDPYILEFLGLETPSGYSEKELETAIIGNLQKFLLEMGKGFSFVGRQYRISTETKHFFIDLVFYNYLLKCFVLIDLKIGDLTHQDIGQMDMYVRLFEDKMKTDSDNPTIGIILCTEKDETIVKYSVLSENRKLFASKYRLVLPTEEELKEEIERHKYLIKKISGE